MTKITIGNLALVFLFSHLCFVSSAKADKVAIRLLDVELVHYADIPSTEWHFGKIKAPQESIKKLLKLDFTSQPLLSGSTFPGYNVIGSGYICDKRNIFKEANEDLVFEHIVSDGKPIESPLSRTKHSGRSAAPMKYSVYLKLMTSRNSSLKTSVTYNLFESPQDICFEITGGKMLFGQINSNIVRVSSRRLGLALVKQ